MDEFGTYKFELLNLFDKGENGRLIYTGTYDFKEAIMKKYAKEHAALALHEIKVVSEVDKHKNIVRYYGRAIGEDCVYIAFQKCIFNLKELILVQKENIVQAICGQSKEETVYQSNHPSSIRTHCLNNSIVMWEYDLSWAYLNWQVKEKLHWKLFPTLHTFKIISEIRDGLLHIHRHDVIHGDLSPANIFLKSENGRLSAKIGDFNLAYVVKADNNFKYEKIGNSTKGWQPREVIEGEMIQGRDQSMAVDVFSFGCLMFCCCTWEHPFGDEAVREINIKAGNPGLKPIGHLPEFYDIVYQCLLPAPEQRPRLSDLVMHPCFWDFRKRSLCLIDASVRVEFANTKNQIILKANEKLINDLEGCFPKLFTSGAAWSSLFPSYQAFLSTKYSNSYDGKKFRDLLRFFRNTYQHFDELSENAKVHCKWTPHGLLYLFSDVYPEFFYETYKVLKKHCFSEMYFKSYFVD